MIIGNEKNKLTLEDHVTASYILSFMAKSCYDGIWYQKTSDFELFKDDKGMHIRSSLDFDNTQKLDVDYENRGTFTGTSRHYMAGISKERKFAIVKVGGNEDETIVAVIIDNKLSELLVVPQAGPIGLDQISIGTKIIDASDPYFIVKFQMYLDSTKEKQTIKDCMNNLKRKGSMNQQKNKKE